jgi:hypothetical protein
MQRWRNLAGFHPDFCPEKQNLVSRLEFHSRSTWFPLIPSTESSHPIGLRQHTGSPTNLDSSRFFPSVRTLNETVIVFCRNTPSCAQWPKLLVESFHRTRSAALQKSRRSRSP